ncbi:hypothetical protein DPEC_G00071600 [Dallia pectoralis]|uniref:Uncharacterized protein n=1 Tax=Dallia pectoralis TaxID=75939 RepID=A0ACC2H2H9_DALPE|nr:hypothetical protein DPEC_G00071600 [Dallia pectoralis]
MVTSEIVSDFSIATFTTALLLTATLRGQARTIRIESWWGFLRRESMEFYICRFADLKDRGLFDGAYLDKGLIQFCFMGIIQDELDETTRVWDSHVLRPSKNDRVPSGRPRVIRIPRKSGVFITIITSTNSSKLNFKIFMRRMDGKGNWGIHLITALV